MTNSATTVAAGAKVLGKDATKKDISYEKCSRAEYREFGKKSPKRDSDLHQAPVSVESANHPSLTRRVQHGPYSGHQLNMKRGR